MKRSLDAKVIDYLFGRLMGRYGAQFVSKFSRLVDGVDVGMESARVVWAEDLGQFAENPEALRWAYDNCPPDHCPNSMEFKKLAESAPRPEQKRIENNIPANPERVAEFADKAAKLMKEDRDHMAWAKFPSSQGAMDLIVAGAKKDVRLRAIHRELVDRGVCSESGALLMAYRDREWVKVRAA